MKTFDDILARLPLDMLKNITNVEYLRGLMDAGYGQSWRTYHNYDHICDMLDMFNSICMALKDMCPPHPHLDFVLKSRWEYVVAIMFHDIVYDLQAPSGENEHDSVQMLYTFGPRCLRFKKNAGIDELIMATVHDGRLDRPLHQLMADIDLSTFGSTTKFQPANNAVWAEYESRFPAKLVTEGRLRFLKSFAERLRIFYHEDFFDNEIAFANIQEAISGYENA
jgi:predicted metal-dependent HD superfamily phosphohydrolase